MARKIRKAIKPKVVSKNTDEAVKVMRAKSGSFDTLEQQVAKNIGYNPNNVPTPEVNRVAKEFDQALQANNLMDANVTAGMSMPDAANLHLDRRDSRRSNIDKQVEQRRARQSSANNQYMSSGSGNKAQKKINAINQKNDLAEEMAIGRVEAQINSRRREEYKQRDGVNSNNATGSGNRAQRRIDKMKADREDVISARRQKRDNDLEAMFERGEYDKLDTIMGTPKAKNPTKREIKAERKRMIESKKAEDAWAAEVENIVSSAASETPTKSKKAPVTEISPSGGNASAKKTIGTMANRENMVYNMAAMGVGGGLVLNMANNKGQQSNQQLYGQ